MSERDSGLSSIGDAIGLGVILFAIVMFFIVVAIVTFLASPGMLIVGTAKLAFGLTHSTRQVWVLSIAASLTILTVLVIVRRNIQEGVALHLLVCAATMILWSVLTYGFESKTTEALAAVFFPGFTMKEAFAPAAAQASKERLPAADQGSPAVDATIKEPEPSVAAVESWASKEPAQVLARHADVVVPVEDEPLPTPTPIPMASFRVALQLPLRRVYVMVRLNDREVFRCDFRSNDQDGTPALVTPPIEAVAGLAVVKVWVISPDKKAADEYVVLPVSLEQGKNPPVRLVLAKDKALGKRLIRALGPA